MSSTSSCRPLDSGRFMSTLMLIDEIMKRKENAILLMPRHSGKTKLCQYTVTMGGSLSLRVRVLGELGESYEYCKHERFFTIVQGVDNMAKDAIVDVELIDNQAGGELPKKLLIHRRAVTTIILTTPDESFNKDVFSSIFRIHSLLSPLPLVIKYKKQDVEEIQQLILPTPDPVVQRRHVWVYGPSGCGKTQWVQHTREAYGKWDETSKDKQLVILDEGIRAHFATIPDLVAYLDQFKGVLVVVSNLPYTREYKKHALLDTYFQLVQVEKIIL